MVVVLLEKKVGSDVDAHGLRAFARWNNEVVTELRLRMVLECLYVVNGCGGILIHQILIMATQGQSDVCLVSNAPDQT